MEEQNRPPGGYDFPHLRELGRRTAHRRELLAAQALGLRLATEAGLFVDHRDPFEQLRQHAASQESATDFCNYSTYVAGVLDRIDRALSSEKGQR